MDTSKTGLHLALKGFLELQKLKTFFDSFFL